MPAKYRYPDGSEYFGDWSDDGQRHGQGQMSFPDGARYIGQFANGLSSGTGIMTFGDGSRFVILCINIAIPSVLHTLCLPPVLAEEVIFSVASICVSVCLHCAG